jgi:hypothetical protein
VLAKLRQRQRVRRWRELKSGIDERQSGYDPLERATTKRIPTPDGESE